ncbi:hypothetical protein GCM10022226_29950 [Sphaerisporangium flaviroseum]|uniref:Uncharacterized protein n=1 Tax=Sphaerisporangium flaviroseum TaxID=509199 RepID=A0ABP7I2E5_9ACTN
MQALVAVVFGVTWWLGLYVIAREPGEAGSRRAGLGLIAYALALLVHHLAGTGVTAGSTLGAEVVAGLETVLVCLPMILWTGACVTLLPEGRRERLDILWRRALVPVTLATLAVVTAQGGIVPLRGPVALHDPTGSAGLGAVLAGSPSRVVPLVLLGALLLAPLATVLVLLARSRLPRIGWLLTTATLFFCLGTALVLFPVLGAPAPPALLAMDVDVILLGVAIAMSSAFQAGEALWRDMGRAFLGAVFTVTVFAGQVGVAMVLGGPSLQLTLLLFGLIAAATAVRTLSAPVHRLLDRLAFPADGELRRERAELHDSAEALPRRAEGPPPMGDAEFVRLTRRALAGYGDLAKLMSSPLVNLPVIDTRLKARGACDRPLERATELRTLLRESILRLKPRDGEFGTSEEWRYYNVLYFPYVAGLRPYRRGASRTGLDALERQAFDWFLTQVPERTLYNWQTAAAKLIADDLRGFVRVDGENRQ